VAVALAEVAEGPVAAVKRVEGFKAGGPGAVGLGRAMVGSLGGRRRRNRRRRW
jgi:hypothetical protein